MNFSKLVLGENFIIGAGEDGVGSFEIAGIVNDRNVKFVKKYFEKHSIFYKGELNEDGREIEGHWGFGEDGEDATFKLYKEDEERLTWRQKRAARKQEKREAKRENRRERREERRAERRDRGETSRSKSRSSSASSPSDSN